MADVNELDKRISMLEVEFENLESNMAKMDVVVHENYESTLAIKERLDKMNGSIPHLVEDVKGMHEMQKQLLDAMTKNTIADAKKAVKLSILWSIAAAIVGAGFTILIKTLVH